MNLVDRILELHLALESNGVRHAFGGALALAWCTRRARATIDIDVNLFVPSADAGPVLDALPDGIVVGAGDRARIESDGQTRLWWDSTPIDVFFDTTPFHVAAADRVRTEFFAGREVPFLACRDLAVFKAFSDRTKDWADLEEMAAAGTLDVEAVAGVLARYLGGDDRRIARLLAL